MRVLKNILITYVGMVPNAFITPAEAITLHLCLKCLSVSCLCLLGSMAMPYQDDGWSERPQRCAIGALKEPRFAFRDVEECNAFVRPPSPPASPYGQPRHRKEPSYTHRHRTQQSLTPPVNAWQAAPGVVSGVGVREGPRRGVMGPSRRQAAKQHAGRVGHTHRVMRREG